MRRCAALLLFLLLLAGCAAAEAEREQGTAYKLYFLETDLRQAAGGGALREETVYLQNMEEAGTVQVAEALLEALLEGPGSEDLESAIPAGTSLLSLKMEGSQALVDFSASYSALSGVSLTLADYAVTLTLTQLPEIARVGITVRGQELAYRDKQIFSARDVLLAPQGDVVSTVPVTLYFLDEDGYLIGEERMLSLYEGDTQVSAVAQALENGPESKNLIPAQPEGFRVKSVWLEEDVCYVNLSSALCEELPPEEADLATALEALARSLCSLESVSETQFLVDGVFASHYGGIDVAEPYQYGEYSA
ncbi:GerMN domain-containing protein [uncultured Dysosmobacter sp.]|uniref:GerMN domain-containing protein n=1 Tax=uncultured Dysosmobacter sp. TaxID=2591384 RepID=UPI00263203DE|nr:GerMN domain-containing protein [uncultured Dysosmobacter sp.]